MVNGYRMKKNRKDLRVGFSSNSTEGTVKDINERRKFEILFSAIANKETTTHTIHAELFLHFAFPSALTANTNTNTGAGWLIFIYFVVKTEK